MSSVCLGPLNSDFSTDEVFNARVSVGEIASSIKGKILKLKG